MPQYNIFADWKNRLVVKVSSNEILHSSFLRMDIGEVNLYSTTIILINLQLVQIWNQLIKALRNCQKW